VAPRKGVSVVKLTREQYRERTAAKAAAAQEVLVAEVASLVTGADWRQFLDFQARLHDYSANNVMLIVAQHAMAHAEGRVPEATPTYIAGFETWRALGRSVERGQHGYTVLAPMRSTRRLARDPQGNVRALSPGDVPGVGETETRTPMLRGFTVATVFDASQTSGKNLPDPPRPRLLAGEAPRGLGAGVKGLIDSKGFSVDSVPDAGHLQGANGQTNWSTKVVLIRADMDDAAMVKTLMHEAAHVLLHQASSARDLPRAIKEVEAESVAYVVASVHGMPTDEYSFSYVAGWAGEDPARAIRETQGRVNAAARAIIAASPAEHMGGAKPPGVDLALTRLGRLGGEVADLDPRPGEAAMGPSHGGADVA
jgi:antirestriction protein ArdC